MKKQRSTAEGKVNEEFAAALNPPKQPGDQSPNDQTMNKKKIIETVVKIIVAALTAALTALTTTSCMGKGPIDFLAMT